MVAIMSKGRQRKRPGQTIPARRPSVIARLQIAVVNAKLEGRSRSEMIEEMRDVIATLILYENLEMDERERMHSLFDELSALKEK